MICDGLDYDKTVDSKKLVFEGQRFEKLLGYSIILILCLFTIPLTIEMCWRQVQSNPTTRDYLIVIILPLILVCLFYYAFTLITNRDKLDEFRVCVKKEKAKFKLLEAANNLKWNAEVVADNYIIFRKGWISKESYTVTLIFFSDNRVYFNSLGWPNDYIKYSRFDDNFNELQNEFSKIEQN